MSSVQYGSGFQHLIRATSFDGLVAMIKWDEKDLTVYFDDSGTHHQTKIATAAAYVSTVEQWTCFENDWNAARGAEGFDVFHAADYFGFHGEFDSDEWRDADKHDRTAKRLVSAINLRIKRGAFHGIMKSDYDAAFGSDAILLNLVGRYHYTFAVQSCLHDISKFREKYYPTARVKYVFDKMSEGKGEIVWLFDQLEKEKENAYGFIPGGYSFESKSDVTQLQAADMLAWHANVHARNRFIPNHNKPLPYMKSLMENHCVVENGIWLTPVLEKLADGLRTTEVYGRLRKAYDEEQKVRSAHGN